MTIWPVIIDSEPGYLGGRSLLALPLGARTLAGHLQQWLEPITRKSLTIVSPSGDPARRRELQTAAVNARIVCTADEFADALYGHELSDAFLFIDPRCLPVHEGELRTLATRYAADPRVVKQLVAFDSRPSGTREHVHVDARGHVRGVFRYYDSTTWPFLAGIAAAMVPAACAFLNEGVPHSLGQLRQVLAAHGVPSRDIPIETGALDLSHEAGLLAASEQFVIAAAPPDVATHHICIGGGQMVHDSVRIVGPVVIHPDAQIHENALVVGPALIGARACLAPGAVVAHAIVAPDAVVPSGSIAQDCVWVSDDSDAEPVEHQPRTYVDRLARAGQPQQPPRAVTRRASVLKRTGDVIASALGLVVLSPVMLAIALVIWLESGRPIFYAQKREGLGGRVFRCWKFRTMSVDADAIQKELKSKDRMDGPHFKLDDDPRVTRSGSILRKANLDEVPQLFNVLRGDMSLVGPRPSPFRENQVCVPWRQARLSVRPGITGLWQVCRHDRASGDFHQWIEYDLLYVKHVSFWLDVKILTATVLTLGGKAHVPSRWFVPTDSGAAPELADPSSDDAGSTPPSEEVAATW